MRRFAALALALLASPALAQPVSAPADVLAAAQSVREALRDDRYLAEATAAFRWCGLRPPEWGETVYKRILDHGRRQVEVYRRSTSDPDAFWRIASQLWDEHWVRINRVASRSRFSASECLDAQQLSDLAAVLDGIYRDNR